MQKRFGLTLFAGLAIIVAACGPGAASSAPSRPGIGRPVRRSVGGTLRSRRRRPSRPPRRSPATRALKVGLVTDVGRVNDKGFNQSAYEGMLAAAEAAPTCFETEYIETTSQSDYATNIAQFTDSGSNVVIGVGFLLGDALGDAAKANTDIKFISVDGVPGRRPRRELDDRTASRCSSPRTRRATSPASSPPPSARRTTSASSAASSSSRRSSASSRATSTARSRSSPTSTSTSCTRPRSSIRPRAAAPRSR